MVSDQLSVKSWLPSPGRHALSELIGIGAQYYDSEDNILYTVESDGWGGSGPQDYWLSGRNPDDGQLVSQFRINDSRWMELDRLASGNWLIGGLAGGMGSNSSYLELKDPVGRTLWITQGVGGRYEMGNNIVITDDEDYAFVPAGTDGNGSQAFGSGVAKIRLADGLVVKEIQEIEGAGAGYSFFKGHAGEILIDTRSKILVFNEDLEPLGEILHPLTSAVDPAVSSRITNILPGEDESYVLVGYHSIGDLYAPDLSDIQVLYGFVAKVSNGQPDAYGSDLEWLVQLDTNGLNSRTTDAKFLANGRIGVIGSTGWGDDGFTYVSLVDSDGLEVGTDLFPIGSSNTSFFVDSEGDIRFFRASGVNATDPAVYTIQDDSYEQVSHRPSSWQVIDFDEWSYTQADYLAAKAEIVSSGGYSFQTILDKGWNDIDVQEGSLIHWGGWKNAGEHQPELRLFRDDGNRFDVRSLDIARTPFSPEYIRILGFRDSEAVEPAAASLIYLSDSPGFQSYTLGSEYVDLSSLVFEGGVTYDDVTQGDFRLDNIVVARTSLPAEMAALGLGYRLRDGSGEILLQNAVLGDSVDYFARYTLEITAEVLLGNYLLESADISLRFDPLVLGNIAASDVLFSSALSIANAVEIDNEAGIIRIVAASLSALDRGSAIAAETVLASIEIDFDEHAISNLERASDGSLVANPLSFEVSVNRDETVLSREFTDINGGLNREIVSLGDLELGIQVAGQDMLLYEAKINLEQQGDGLVIGTQRVIGADAAFTNLVRSRDTISASVDWLNVGNIEARNLFVSSIANASAELVGARLSTSSIQSGAFVNGSFDPKGRETVSVSADVYITGSAGKVVNLSEGIFSIAAEGSEGFLNAGKGSKNLITFQGDLNYDGRVSMKDLAYLNAGAARQRLDASTGLATADSYARDVDADFNGKIDLADLAVLDQDWGKSLHTGQDSFVGSSEVSWDALDAQGASSTWNNDSFKDQNAVEAAAGYVGSLESPTAAGVIGADGNTTANDGGIQGTYFQDPLAA